MCLNQMLVQSSQLESSSCDQFCLLQGQMNRLYSSFELVVDRRLFKSCSESVCHCPGHCN